MKKKLGTIGLTVLMVITGIIGVSEAAVDDISSDITRLHILANSNTDEDISLKFKVRDRLITEYASEITLEDIEKICADEIEKNGKNYAVKVEKGRFYFPTKKYENISLPAGEYDAVRVIIGEGKGTNWWCIMYPPLCFSQSTGGEMNDKNTKILESGMKRDNFDMITEDAVKIKPAFKIVEIWQKVKNKF